MSGERIDIEVQDKVSPAVRDKILGIATAARTADSALDKLKRQLAAIDATGVEKLSNASAKLTNALAREINAQARLTTATIRQATEDGKAALAKQKLATEAARTAAAEARLAAEQARASNASSQAAASATRYEAALLRLKQAQDKAAQGNTNLSRSGAGASGGLASAAQGAISAAGSYIGGREILQVADAYTTLENKLRTVTDSSRQLAAVQAELFKIANETRAPVADTATSFQRFDMAMKELGASQRETLDLTKTLNQAIQLSGATTSEAQSGMIQLAQAFGSGKIQGDEFRSIMENLPVVADILAKQLKVTRGELKDLASAGKITAEVMRAAFASARVEIGERFAKSVPTLAQSMSVLNNNFVAYVGQVDKATGATSLLSQGVLGIANNINIAAPAMAALGIVAISFSSSIVGGFGAATAAVRTFTIALLTNPVGILIVAVTAAIALLYTFRDSLFVAGDGVTTLGDLFRAVWQITVEAFNAMWAAAQAFFTPLMELARPVIETVQGWFKGFGENVDLTFRGIVTFVARYYDTIIGIGVGSVKAMIAAWGAFPGALADLILRAVNAGIKLMEDFVNGAIALLNKLIGVFNAIGDNELTRKLGINFTALSDIANVEFGRIENTYAGGFERLGTSTRDAFLEGFNGSNALVNGVNTVFARATKIANERRDAQRELASQNARLGDPLRQPGAAAKVAAEDDGKAAKAAEKRAMALANINRELENEIARMGQLQPQREIERQLDAIINDLKGKNITLTQQEIAGYRQQITERERANRVASEMDRIYQETQGPLQKHADTLAAINRLLQLNAISQAEATRQINIANEAREDALNPLRQSQQALRDEIALMQYYGRELAIQTELQRRFNEAKAVGLVTEADRGRYFTENRESVAQTEMRRETRDIVSPIVEDVTANDRLLENAQRVYAEIERLRQQDVLSEQQAAQAKAQFDEMVLRARLSRTTQFLGTIAELQNSHNKKLRAIGRAAAIAQASIDTYVAANKALSAFPPPFNFVAAAAVVAAGIANVAKIAGFERGGYTGIVGRKEVAGVVHGQEFVVNAAATAKNRPLLEAINRGDSVFAGGYERGGFVATPTAAYSEAAVGVSAASARQPANDRGAKSFRLEYNIDARGSDAGVAERLEAVLAAHKEDVVQAARQASLEDLAELSRRQRIGGGY